MLAGPWPPWLLFKLKRKLLAASAGHRFDMERLYVGPPIDLPKFVGKAYAFCFVAMAYSAVLPILYLAGIVFFGGLWLCETLTLTLTLTLTWRASSSSEGCGCARP